MVPNPPCVFRGVIQTRRSLGWTPGAGRPRTAFARLNSAGFAPMPIASMRIARIENPGARVRKRMLFAGSGKREEGSGAASYGSVGAKLRLSLREAACRGARRLKSRHDNALESADAKS